MRRMLPLLLLAALPGTAHSLQPGVALRWDSCLEDGGAANRAFACDTNTGVETLVGSFVPTRDVNGVAGYEPQVDFFSSAAGIPAWWNLKNAGSCRQQALSMLFTPPPGAVSCVDPAPGLMSGGIGAYEIGFGSPQRIRLRGAIAVALPDTFSLLNDHHYFAFRLQITHAKTTGAGSCAGCSIPMCIGFSGITITSLDSDPEPTFECLQQPPPNCGTRNLFRPADGSVSDRVTWQGGAMPAFTTGPDFGPEGTGFVHAFRVFEVACDAATPTRPSTWGAIKSLYR